MTVHLQEHSTLVVLSDEQQNLAAGVSTTTPYINAIQCDNVNLIVRLDANATTVAADQVKLEVVAASDNSGTNAEVVNFQYLYTTVGAPEVRAGTGRAVKTSFSNATTGALEKRADYTTPLNQGNVELQIAIPIRERQLPVGKKWLALRMTTGANTRRATNIAIRCEQVFGAEAEPAQPVL